MKVANLIPVMVTTMLVTICSPPIVGGTVTVEETNTLPVTNEYLTSYGNFNIKIFEVEAGEAGSYNAGFWLQPSRYADESYSRFYVYVNSVYVGTVSPSEGGWQSVSMDDGLKLDLEEGLNAIAVATVVPQFPDVETIMVSTEVSQTVMPSDAYDEFYEAACEGITYDVPYTDDVVSINTTPTAVTEVRYTDVPLIYTAKHIFTLAKGATVHISSSSEIQHDLDVIFYGTAMFPNQAPPALSDEEVFPKDPTIYELLPDMSILVKQNFSRASSTEMQTYFWHGISTQPTNSSKWLASVDLTAPLEGMYLVRVRSHGNGLVLHLPYILL